MISALWPLILVHDLWMVKVPSPPKCNHLLLGPLSTRHKRFVKIASKTLFWKHQHVTDNMRMTN